MTFKTGQIPWNKGVKTGPNPEHSLRLLGRKRPEQSQIMRKYAIEGKLPAMGKKTEESKKRHSAFMIDHLKQNAHPRGMLGKKQSARSVEVSRNFLENMWRNPQSRVNSSSYRQILSNRATLQHKNGFLNQTYSRCKMGHYDINGKNMFFRSLWEANYALYLDFLIDKKQIKKWEYEVDTFWFENIMRGVRSYKPDFKVYNLDNTIEYHEVKGWMDAKSNTKLKRMAKYYPKIKVILIQKEEYKDLKKKIGRLAGFYD